MCYIIELARHEGTCDRDQSAYARYWGGVLVPFLISPASAITCREFFSALDRTAETGNFEMPKWDKVKDIGIERFIECKDQG